MLTVNGIKALKPKDKTYQMREGKGFGIRIFPSGEKTFFFAYKFHGRQRMMKLGIFPEKTLHDARDDHKEARTVLANGKCPLTEKQLERVKPTVDLMVKEYLSRHVQQKAPRSFKEYERNLTKDVIPAWGKIRIKDITRKHVYDLLEKIVDRGAKNQANQVFKIVRAMFNWAVPRYNLEYSPCSLVKLPSKENKRDRYLSEKEICTFWQELKRAGISDAIKRALLLVLITGQRPGEVIGMHSRDIDGDWWTITAGMAKNNKEHRAFLSSLAKKIIGISEEGYIFPSPCGNKSISVNAISKAVRRNSTWAQKTTEDKKNGKEKFFFSIKQPWTPHDLRRTCATHMGKAGFTDEVIGRVLNHTRTGITSIYNRHEYDDEIEKALSAWSLKLESITYETKRGKVLPFMKI